jgi:hypothetical protein
MYTCMDIIVVIKQGTGVHICTLQDAHIILIYVHMQQVNNPLTVYVHVQMYPCLVHIHMYVTHVRSTWIIRDIFSTLRVYAIHYSILIVEPGSLPLPTYYYISSS